MLSHQTALPPRQQNLLEVEELQFPGRNGVCLLSPPHPPWLPAGTGSARTGEHLVLHTADPREMTLILNTRQAKLPPQPSLSGTRAQRAHWVILTELAAGTHLLLSLYAFSHTVPFYHFPLGWGRFISHCLDTARSARLLPAISLSRAGHCSLGTLGHAGTHWDGLSEAQGLKKSRNPQMQGIFTHGLM